MGIVELLFLAIGLSMDAFAVSVCKGLSLNKASMKSCFICGVWFGSFQTLMPMIGYLLGTNFEKYIIEIAPWIAFVLLMMIGWNMIREAVSDEDECEECVKSDLGVRTMFLMAIATSIDALAVGITFVCVPVKIIAGSCFLNTVASVIIIGITTLLFSSIGVKIGNVFGSKYKKSAEIAGGIILMGIGIKILAEHLLF